MRVRQRSKIEKKQEEYFANLVSEGVLPPECAILGITREDIRLALESVDRGAEDLVDVVFALLDADFPNLFDSNFTFKDGASTAHIACYVGIFLRRSKKLDREGRDYWIKPLRELGIIQPVTFDPKTRSFLDGHLVSKSPNSAYRIDPGFIDSMLSDKQEILAEYFQQNEIALRLKLQADALNHSALLHGRGEHFKLIELIKKFYIPNFLKGYEICFVDAEDGQRISNDEINKLSKLGLMLSIDDVYPDLILISNDDHVWFIEAVVSDGEIDESKLKALKMFCLKNKKIFAGATTCYLDWRSLARRQDQFKNLAASSFVWLASDPSKQLWVQALV